MLRALNARGQTVSWEAPRLGGRGRPRHGLLPLQRAGNGRGQQLHVAALRQFLGARRGAAGTLSGSDIGGLLEK